MTIDDELLFFEGQLDLLLKFIQSLAKIDAPDIKQEDLFLAEAVTFRLFRSYERFVRACFLDFCVKDKTKNGKDVTSKLKCSDWETAENILKSGNKFLDWGNVDTVRSIANLVYKDGFPINDLISPINSTLKDLQRFRNFIAHDSNDAAKGFKTSRTQYVKVGHTPPETVGELALYRRKIRADITLKILHDKVQNLAQIYKTL